MSNTILHKSLTPVNTTFLVRVGQGLKREEEVVVFEGDDVTSQGDFDRVMASPEQACAAAIAVLAAYAPKVLRKRVRSALDEGVEPKDLLIHPGDITIYGDLARPGEALP